MDVLDLTAGRWAPLPGGRRVIEMTSPTRMVQPSAGAARTSAQAAAEAAVRAWCGDPAPPAPADLSNSADARRRREIAATLERYGAGFGPSAVAVEM